MDISLRNYHFSFLEVTKDGLRVRKVVKLGQLARSGWGRREGGIVGRGGGGEVLAEEVGTGVEAVWGDFFF